MFSVATSRLWRHSQSDEWKEETDWHNIVLWRSENLANYLTKGKQVYVEGRLQTSSYEDLDNVKRYITEIVADGVILLGGQQGGSQDQPASGKGNNKGLVSQPRGRAAAASAPPACIRPESAWAEVNSDQLRTVPKS
jgi:single-strand DNA-binding protein